jgi:hypothetical protein
MSMLFPSTYFGPISYYALLLQADGKVVIDVDERFVKQTVRNRCEILGANGQLRMTVPLVKWSTKIPVKEIMIDNSSNWKHVHWMSLISAYRNAPFFEHYEDKIRTFYSSELDSLTDLNIATIQLSTQLLKVELNISASSEIIEIYNQNCMDYRPLFRKKRPIQKLSEYQQVFSDRFPFTPDLSILDLIFNLGPRASIYLRNSNMNGQR